MSKRTGWILFLLLAAVFLFCNRGAYRGYFQDDEINAMSWTRFGPATIFLKGLSPIYKDCFRAVGFYFFRVTEARFGLDFPKYVAVIQAIHLFNVWMVWLLLRRLGAQVFPACFALAFFALHAALFDAVWKPAFVFDLLCTTLCLASTLLWIQGRWIASFVLFWLAFQTKEPAVMLPLVLVCYELWFGVCYKPGFDVWYELRFGERRWQRLTLGLFLAGSFSFAFQALILHPIPSGDYSYHFTPITLATTADFYAGQVFLVPLFGLVLPAGAWLAGNRRTWFGLTAMTLYFVPYLFLPGRIDAAYCYLPFTGLAVALAGIAETRKTKEVAIFFLLWLPLDLYWLHAAATDKLRQDQDIRAWMGSAAAFAKVRPDVVDFAFDGLPDGFRQFGVGATFKYFLQRDINVVPLDSPEGAKLIQGSHVAILRWRQDKHQLEIATP
jgi:hypothetical protein